MPTLLSVFGIIPFKIGGQEAFARELSSQLSHYGWRSVLCFESVPPDEVRRYLALPNVSLEVMESPERIRWHAVRTLAGIMRRERPEILHLYYTGFLGPYPWLAQWCSVKRVFFTDQGSRPTFHVPQRASFWKRRLARVINRPLSKVICVSGYGYRCMTTLDLLPADRFALIYSAVDLRAVPENPADKAAEFRQKCGIPAGRSVITQVSWIIPEKGIADFLGAAQLVIAKNPNVHFVLVGEGSHRGQYTQLAGDLGLQDHVTWTGLVQDPLGEGAYAAADVVCQVSRWEEVFGYVIPEAMACGKPVVATRVGGIPEIVRDGETGFLVPRGDTAQIADRILQLLADRELRERFGRAGRQSVAAKFDLKQNVAQLLHLYDIS